MLCKKYACARTRINGEHVVQDAGFCCARTKKHMSRTNSSTTKRSFSRAQKISPKPCLAETRFVRKRKNNQSRNPSRRNMFCARTQTFGASLQNHAAAKKISKTHVLCASTQEQQRNLFRRSVLLCTHKEKLNNTYRTAFRRTLLLHAPNRNEINNVL